MAAGQGSEKAMSSGGESKPEGGGAALPPEPVKSGGDGDAGLGKMLAAAREKRGMSRADVVAETRIPANYLQMIESSDYGLISDQLYLLPFVRRYSAFLGLDGEEVAMRFVREVQRAEGAAPARMSEPLMLTDGKRRHWGRLLAAAAILAAVVVLYFLASEHHHATFEPQQAAIRASSGGSEKLPPVTVAPRTEAPLKAPDTSVIANPTGAAAPEAAAGARGSAPPATGDPAGSAGAASPRSADQPASGHH